MLCYVFDLDDVLLQTTSIFSSERIRHIIENTSDIVKAYKHCIQPDPELYQKLKQLQGPKFVLTNASRVHAYASIQALQIQQFFIGQLDADSGIRLKPSFNAYLNMQKIINNQLLQKNKTIVFFDDRLENLVAPFQMGWVTIWIKPYHVNIQKPNYVSYIFSTVHDALSYMIHLQSSTS